MPRTSPRAASLGVDSGIHARFQWARYPGQQCRRGETRQFLRPYRAGLERGLQPEIFRPRPALPARLAKTQGRRGSVIFISGIGARAPVADYMIGAAVIGASFAFMKALADLGKRDRVQVNTVNPGRPRPTGFAMARHHHEKDRPREPRRPNSSPGERRHSFGTPEILRHGEFHCLAAWTAVSWRGDRYRRRTDRAAANVGLRLDAGSGLDAALCRSCPAFAVWR